MTLSASITSDPNGAERIAQNVVARSLSQVKACYRVATNTEFKRDGQLFVEFKLGAGDTRARDVKVIGDNFGDPRLNACAQKIVEQAEFAKSDNALDVVAPLTFGAQPVRISIRSRSTASWSTRSTKNTGASIRSTSKRPTSSRVMRSAAWSSRKNYYVHGKYQKAIDVASTVVDIEPAIAVAEQTRGAGTVAAFQPLAHGGAAYPHAVRHERLHLLDAEAMRPPRLDQAHDGSLGPSAIAKIMPHHHVSGAQAPHDEPLHEALRRHHPHRLVEGQRDQSLDTDRRQGQKLFAPAREPGRRPFRIDEFLGTRFEHQHRRGAAQLRSARQQHADHALMAEVHPVIIADGQYAAPAGRTTVGFREVV